MLPVQGVSDTTLAALGSCLVYRCFLPSVARSILLRPRKETAFCIPHCYKIITLDFLKHLSLPHENNYPTAHGFHPYQLP